MSWFRRRPTPAVKAAEFSRDVVETIRAYGFGYCGTYGAMYRRQPAVRTVVDFLARNVAQLNAKVYERVSNTDRLELHDHPAAGLLRHPNPVTTRYRHMFATVADMAIYDRAYWRILRQQDRLAVVRISPEILHANDETQPDGTLRRVYRLTDGTIIPRPQLVIFPGYSPDNFDEGVSPLETLRRVLEEEAASIAHRHSMWRNAARQSGWIQRPVDAPDWSDEARRRFRTDLEAMMTGAANAGRIGVLEDGMIWNGNSFSPKDTEYVAGRRLTYEEVAVVYGIDPSLFGLGSATKSSAEQKHQEVYQDVLGPLLRQIQDELDLQLLPLVEPAVTPGSTYVEFNIAEKLKGSFEQQATVLTTSVGVPVMTPNEGRARLNLPRIDDPDFDIPIMPMNVIYGGQPAVTIPTETPGSPVTASYGPLELPTPADHDLTVRRAEVVKAHTDLFHRFFERQAQAVLSAGGGRIDRARWDRELAADLSFLAVDLGFDRDLADTRETAEKINRWTFDELDETGDPRRVFAVAKTDRVDQHAADRAAVLVPA